jgi:hypothetical protein
MQDFWDLMEEGLAQELPEHLHPAFRKVTLHQYLDSGSTLH